MSHIAITSLEFASMDVDDAGTAALHFRPRRPLRFTAGQHGLWVVPGGGLKPFTIASAPEEELVTLGTSLSSLSRFKRSLGALRAGSTVRFVGPLASFTLEDTAPSIVMLAQGLGVTPFRSMLRHAAISGLDKRTTLMHVGARHPFRADTAAAATRALYPASREEFASLSAAVARSQPDATFMVSGTPAFVKATAALLKDNSVDRTQIKRDSFYGYSPTKTGPLSAPLTI